MDDAAFVGGIERACHLSRQGDRLFEWQRAARRRIGKRGTFDEFEHESPHGMALEQLVVDPVNSADVLVVERSEHLGFAFEAGEAFGVAGERVRENLDGHLAPERGVSCARYTSPMPPAPSLPVISGICRCACLASTPCLGSHHLTCLRSHGSIASRFRFEPAAVLERRRRARSS